MKWQRSIFANDNEWHRLLHKKITICHYARGTFKHSFTSDKMQMEP